jgi:hypothetical protein
MRSNGSGSTIALRRDQRRRNGARGEKHVYHNLSVFDNLLMGAYTREDTASIEEDIEKV